MLAIKRLYGLIIALSVFILSLVFFDLLPFLEMQTEIATMNSAAISFESTYNLHKNEAAKLRVYSETIAPGTAEIKKIADFFREKGYTHLFSGDTLSYSGNMNTENFTELMSLLQQIELTKIEQFSFENPISLPIQIGEEKENTIRIQILLLKTIPIDKNLIGG